MSENESFSARISRMSRVELLSLKYELELNVNEIKLQIKTAHTNPDPDKNWIHKASKALIYKRDEINQIVVELAIRKEENNKSKFENHPMTIRFERMFLKVAKEKLTENNYQILVSLTKTRINERNENGQSIQTEKNLDATQK